MTRSPTFKTAALIWTIFWARAFARRGSRRTGRVRVRRPGTARSWTSSPTPWRARSPWRSRTGACGSRRAPLAHLTAPVAPPHVTSHDAAEAGDRGRRVRRRGYLVNLFLARQQRPDRRLELLSGGRLLSHLEPFNRRFAVPLTIRHSVRPMTIAASTTTIKYGIHDSVPSRTLNCSWRNRRAPKSKKKKPKPTRRLPAAPQATNRPRSLIGLTVSSLMYLIARSLISS